MPTVQVEAQLSVDELLKAVEQLSQPDLEAFVQQVLRLQAKRRWPSLPEAETGLLMEINSGLPSEQQQRYDELASKRKSESLTSEEHSELLRLSDLVESLDARRIERLMELALLRQVSPESLMKELGIRRGDDA
jgi:hypothetical protein